MSDISPSKTINYKLWAFLAIFAVVYLIVHFLIFDEDFHYTGLRDFIIEGKGHILHIAPLLLIFGYFFAKEFYRRFQSKEKGVK